MTPHATSPTDDRSETSRLMHKTMLALPACSGNFAAATLIAMVFAGWMGVAEFGVYAFAFHVIRLLSLVSGLGLNQAAVRLIPRYRKAGDHGAVNGFIAGAATLTVIVGIATGAAVWLIAIGTEDTRSHEALIHAIWLVPLIGLGLLLSGVLKAHGRILLGTAAQGGVRDGVAMLIALLVIHGDAGMEAEDGLIALGLAVGLATVLQIGQTLFAGLLTRHRPTMDLPQWKHTAFPMAIASAARLLVVAGDVILLKLIAGSNEAGLFHAAMVLAMVVLVPARAVLAGASPMLSRHADPGEMPVFSAL